jgi:hypothetical protein
MERCRCRRMYASEDFTGLVRGLIDLYTHLVKNATLQTT